MLTGKQRAALRALANPIETIFQIGKGGISEALVVSVDKALTARELIKLRALENSLLSAREAAQQLAERTGSEIIQVIGTRFVLYRKNAEEPKITIPS